MKIRSKGRADREQAISLLELLVYMALFAVVVGFAVTTFFDSWDHAKALRRNADAVASALDVGERWRADIRDATGPVQITDDNGVEQCRIPVASGQITYISADGKIRRQAGTAAPTLWIANVNSSRMQSDPRGTVAAWRWELELKTPRKDIRLRPLFTFESVAGIANNP